MQMDKQLAGSSENVLKRMLDLSRRISAGAPPMKPFLRFSKHADALYRGKTKDCKHFFWDFDYALQGVLLSIARTIATSAEISDACIERWKLNLENLYQRSRRELEVLQKNKKVPQFPYTARSEFIFSRVNPGGRLLYVGCGSGTECLSWAQRGYEVVGIDTDRQLVAIANEWAKYLGLPFQAICMDADNMSLAPGSFDGLLLEFYGFQPSITQALNLQRGLAGVLNDDGKGFIVATRKQYPSYWHMMSKPGYPDAMHRWLTNQCRLDLCFSQMDACEEKLAFGLYMRSHTTESLTRELSGNFDIQECRYEEYDPRYVMSVVKKKKYSAESAPDPEHNGSGEWPGQKYPQRSAAAIEDILNQIQKACDLLEMHGENVERYFLAGEYPAGSPLSFVDTDIPAFIELLDRIRLSSDFSAASRPGLQ